MEFDIKIDGDGNWNTILDGAVLLTNDFLLSTDPCAPAPLLLHGRQVPRLLYYHHRLLARPDRRYLRRLLDRPLPAYWWQGPSDRGLLVPPEVNETRK